MKNTRILTIASVIIGVCAGYMIQEYLHAPESFAIKDHLALICLIIGMVLFILGHLKFKKSSD